MSKQKNKCLHKFKKVDISKTKGKKYIVFKCTLPFCQYYIAKHLVEGKECICNRCNQIMLMTKAAMELVYPHCLECTKSKRFEDAKVLADVLKNI